MTEIRLASDRDAELVVGMVNDLILELGGNRLSCDYAQAVCSSLLSDHDAGFALIADENGVPVGLCTVSFQSAVRTLGRYAIVQEMYVKPERRDQKIGAELIQHAVTEAQRRGCRVIELGTPPDGARQERFYQRLGFQSVGLRMRKTLAQG